jgi:hypothetical protein
MSDTPLYEAMCKALHDLFRNLDREAQRISDPAERLNYYMVVAMGATDAEMKLERIRRRAERNTNKLLREGVMPREEDTDTE